MTSVWVFKRYLEFYNCLVIFTNKWNWKMVCFQRQYINSCHMKFKKRLFQRIFALAIDTVCCRLLMFVLSMCLSSCLTAPAWRIYFNQRVILKSLQQRKVFGQRCQFRLEWKSSSLLKKKKTILGWGFLINSFSRLSISVQRKFRKRKKLDLKKQRKKIMSKYFDQLKHKRHCYA